MLHSLLLALLLPQAPLAAAKPEVISFGTNTPEWTEKLEPSAVRLACGQAPARCLAQAVADARHEGVGSVYLAIDLNPATIADYAAEYSRLSLGQRLLYEIGIDDFVDSYGRLLQQNKTPNPTGLLSEVVANAKGANPRLNFGVTLYETDLDSACFQDDRLPSAFRDRVDFVHLYLRHRANARRYPKYVRRVERLFPRARVIAGAYPYDRSDYVPCKQGGARSCPAKKELAYFKKALKKQLGLLRDGRVAGLEFYPAGFGREASWSGWDMPAFCRPERRQECIADTRAMRQYLLETLAAGRGPAPRFPFKARLSGPGPNGLITNEFAYWRPKSAAAVRSPDWEMTSGSLFAREGAAWTGRPDNHGVDAASANGTGSAVFRLTTVRDDFHDVAVELKLRNDGLGQTASTPAVAWDGIHVFLRYQNQRHLYYASINRRDDKVVIKKKIPGGPSNGGTYYSLTPESPYPVPYHEWQAVRATVRDNPDGSVAIALYADGRLLVSAVDDGSVGGPPIRHPGKVGLRGDNADFSFSGFTVTPLP